MAKWILIGLFITVFASSTLAQIPGFGRCPRTSVVQNFDLSRYLGQWFEIKAYPHTFQLGGKCSRAFYSVDENGQGVVVNTMERLGRVVAVIGTLELASPNQGILIVNFPSTNAPETTEPNYYILGTDYNNYAVVHYCSQVSRFFNLQFAWVLSRTQELSEAATLEIFGCENSALFNAFSEHILHRLQIKQDSAGKNPKIRITFLSRGTKYRKVLNEDELVERITSYNNFSVKRVNYGKHLSFKDQLKITRNTDVFIGMHGAGLTHLLFLPKWATLFELYNCEDPNCYKDLARLRGVNYITWENSSNLESFSTDYKDDHEKFKNYKFNVDEFDRLVKKAASSVQNDPEYKSFLLKSQPEKRTSDEL